MSEVQMDFIANKQSQGIVANALRKSGALNINKKRPYLDEEWRPCVTIYLGGDPTDINNYEAKLATELGININADTTLLPDEWKELDEAIEEVAHEELTVYDYFVGKGLTKPMKNAYGTTVLQWRTISDSQEAIMTMDGVVRGQGDRAQFADMSMPIPILHADYEINSRFLEVSRKDGTGMDVEEATNAARRIREKKEDLLIGANKPFYFGGGYMYSFLTFPHRNPVTLNGAWDDPSTTVADILEDVRQLKRANKSALRGGPAVLILPDDYEDRLGQDYSVSGSSLMTVRERLLKLGGIEDIIFSSRMATGNILLVELSKRTVEIITGMALTNLYWETEGGMVGKYKLMEITVPRFKADYYGRSGIAHGVVPES